MNDYFNSKETENCYSNCPDDCEEPNYGLQVTTAKYPSKWYANILKNSVLINNTIGPEYLSDYLLLQQSTLMINVFYDEMHYDIIEDTPAITFELLVANIVGFYGLFIGSSFLCIVDVIELMYRFSLVFIRKTNFYKKIKNKKVKNEDAVEKFDQNENDKK